MKTNNKAFKYLMNMDMIIASLALIILVLITFFGVIMRYFLNSPFVWLQEVQLWCFTWVVFFGGGAAFRSGSHVAIDVLVDRMPLTMKKIVEVCGYLVSMIVLAYLLMHGTNLVKQLLQTGRVTNILHVPYPIVYGAFPLGCVLMMINYTMIMLKSLSNKNVNTKGGE
ncbi:TRAP transporter small permease [Crassaminicella profunda]|uniref:TRAP transporter small permease n=1 Tax=Crassaminicella profunda TaxID=1286698 RepID=UPI001CA68D8A|nr:TRAP transporter small permease [Crassaminicella profunda]QZY54360.1 TRAP transporter small permease [Crassaminicella profunda]